MTSKPIAQPGKNCWKVAHADRVAMLDDTAAYYEAVADAFEQAERSILILGWDIHSRIQLRRRSEDSRDLLQLLDDCVRERPELEVRILVWREDIIFAFEREMMQRLRFWRKAHDNIEFQYDETAPRGSSHHQKIVVVDDTVSFVGGIDMAQRRWDTVEHLPDDPRRKTPNRLSFDPFHDIQAVCDGEAARALAELARWRWEHAIGEELAPVADAGSRWPSRLTPDFEDVDVAISRTLPTWLVEPDVREVQELFIDSFEAAKHLIYIENQYLTSSKLNDVLLRRLGEVDGPEIVIILPDDASGIIEEATLDTIRVKLLDRLRDADEHDRLRVVYPVVGEDDDQLDVYVHAKVCAIDDQLLRVGSANLSNRSLGVDSECDVVVEGRDASTREAIAKVRNRWLGNHLGLTSDEIAAAYERHGSFVSLLDAHSDGERRLVRLESDIEVSTSEWWGDEALLDPETPPDAERLAEQMMPRSAEESTVSYAGLIALLGLLILMAGLWQFTPLGQWADPRLLAEAIEPLTETWWSVPIALASFTLLSVLAFPTSVLILAMGFIFGALWGSLLALGGSLISAAISFAIGHALGKDTVGRIAGERAESIEKWVAKRGVWSVVAVRMVPVAPFGVVNTVIGSSRIPLRDFLWGTLIGMTPGIILKGIFGDELADFLVNPDLFDLIALIVIVVLFFGVGLGVSRMVKSRQQNEREPQNRSSEAESR